MKTLIFLLTSTLTAPVALADDKVSDEQAVVEQRRHVVETEHFDTIVTTGYTVFRLKVDGVLPDLVPLPPPTLLWSPPVDADNENNIVHPYVLIQQKKVKKSL